MFKRAASFLGLSLLAACSASPGETAESSHEALSLTFGSLSVTPTDTTITIAYEEPGTTPLAVTLGGHTITATYDASGSPQNQSVVFTGLQPCTSYSWSVPAFSGAVTGQTNTHWTGNTACAATNVLKASQMEGFIGAEHQEQNNLGCGSAYEPWASTWPLGYAWVSPAILNESAASAGLEFGYEHYSNGSSWCAESTVEAWRGELKFDVLPTQTARGVTKAVLNANYVSSGNAIPAINPVCSPKLAYLVQHVWTEPTTDVGVWEAILDDGFYSYALVPENFLSIIVASGTALSTEENAGTMTSLVYSSSTPMQLSQIVTGFASLDDGFPDLMSATETWAVDNNSCRTTLSDVAMTLTFQPMPPETPICTAAISCNTATITCGASPEAFQLENAAGAVLATFDGTGGTTPTFTVPNTGLSDTYTACTVSSSGATACAPVTFVSDVACPPCVVTTTCEGSCGSVVDNCGGTLQCGGCTAPLVCSNLSYCSKCAHISACAAGEFFNDETCTCAATPKVCICGGTYPACKVCQ